MALDAVISTEKHGSLSDVLKAEYKEQNGMFFLDVTPSEIKDKEGKQQRYALEDVRGLKDALADERDKKKDLEKANKLFEGLDAAEAKSAIAKLKELGDGASDEEAVKVRLATMKKELETKHGDALNKLTGDIKLLEGVNSKLLVDDQVSRALAGQKLVEGGAKILTPYVKSQITVTKDESTGDRRAVIMDPSTGKPKMSMKSGNTDYMTVDEFVESMAEDKDYGAIFQAKEKSGTLGKKQQQKTQDDPPASKRNGIQTTFRNPAAALMELRGRESEGGG